MDIVQYLHGLVSHPLGISSEDASADLLKQYYALSVIHIVEHNIDIKDKKNHSLLNIWASQTLPLTKRLARSFHMDEMQTLTLLRTVTPMMMTELNGVAGSLRLSEFVAQHFHRSRTHLPAWSSQFIRADFVNLDDITDEEPAQDNESPTTAPVSDEVAQPVVNSPANQRPRPPKKTQHHGLILGGVLASLLVIGVGAWYAFSLQSEQTVAPDPNVTTPSVQALDIPRLSITSGDNRDLYACQAQVGSEALHNQLIQILEHNFGQANCIIDISTHFGSSLAGLERLESIIAMLKSEPFSSIEIVGDEIFVNTPNTQVLNRLVNDIALLAPQFKVSAVPPLDVAMLTNQSLDKATQALNALEDPPNVHDLARAMSLQVLDFNGTDQIPAQNHAVLALSAKKLAQNPNAKLLIITHTDSGGVDHASNVTLSQSQAEAVRAFLVQNGASDAQLVTKGVGSAFPVADNITMVGRFKNRRTEFLAYDEAVLQALSVNPAMEMPAMPSDGVAMAGEMSMMSEPTVAMPPQSTFVPQSQPMPTNVMPANPMPTNTITPMPVQGMPNAQTYAPAPMPAQTIEPYQGEVAYSGGGGTIIISEPNVSGPPIQMTPSSVNEAPPAISDEVMELSKPVHVEIGRGVSHEISE